MKRPWDKPEPTGLLMPMQLYLLKPTDAQQFEGQTWLYALLFYGLSHKDASDLANAWLQVLSAEARPTPAHEPAGFGMLAQPALENSIPKESWR